jgi:IS30 family transposase
VKSKNHLNKDIRDIIESKLDQGFNFTDISKIIYKDRRTISRDILKHRIKKYPSNWNNSTKNFCKNRFDCNSFNCNPNKSCYNEDLCPSLLKPPYVCNGCDGSQKGKCRKIKFYYYAKKANDDYLDILSSSRLGINLSLDIVYEINKTIKPLIVDKHHSINQVYINHPNLLPFSKVSFYNYIDLGVFDIKNIDLPHKVTYKPRKDNKNKRTKKEAAVRMDRKYDDYLDYIGKNKSASIVQMDTVEGIKGSKLLLTLLIVKTNFMFIFLIDNKTPSCITKVFNFLKYSLGNDLFKVIFEVILTDNGSEFYDPISIEVDNNTGEVLSHLFYCNPSASYQKGAIEKNHEFIREVLPKGTSFEVLTQNDCNLLMCHINSIPRISLGNKTPYELTLKMIGTETLEKIGIKKINPDDILRSSRLLKKAS